MFEETFLRYLGMILFAGVVFAYLGRALKVPSLVMYMIAGILLGPIFGLVEMEEALELIAEVGIILLLFLVGLELSLDRIRDVGKVALFAGIGQVLFTAAGGLVVCLLLGFSMIQSVFLAVALTFSSTVVVVKLLDLKGEIDHLYGRIAIGIFLVQDLVVILVMTFLAGLGSAAGEEESAVVEEAAWWTTAADIGLAFVGMGFLLAFVLVASKYILPKPFSWAARSPETVFIWSLAWCFLIVLLAKFLNLSEEIGAFLAGLSLAQLPYHKDLERRVHPLMNFFIAVFFVTLGVQMEFTAAFENLGAVLILSLFVLIGNPFIFMLIITRMKYKEKTAFKTSVTVAQISEFSFIFAYMGIAAGLIGLDLMSIISAVGLITIAVSAYMILYSDPLYEWCRKLRLLAPFKARQGEDREEKEKRVGHVAIVGMNGLGRRIAEALVERGERVLGIDNDPGKLEGLGVEGLIGNVEDLSLREEANLDSAKMVISALQIEDTNLILAWHCQECGVPFVVNAFDLSIIPDLLDLNSSYLMTPFIDGLKMQEEILEKMEDLRK
ncbi:MAG: cation:proton antiporter [Opitutales bacterium]|nr:cation:proton antiporter [Opitutales bacterium]